MKSKKGLSIIEASVVVALMLILALGGLVAGSQIVAQAETNDCVKNLGTLFSLQRTEAALNGLDNTDAPDSANVFANVDSAAAFFCKTSVSTEDRYLTVRMEADYAVGTTNTDFPSCISLGGITPTGHVLP
jgi:Tfp pilus assembly protein FimT